MVEVHYHNTHHSTLLQERQKLENFGRELVSAHSGSGLCACHFVRVLVCVRVVGAVLVIGPSAEMPRQPGHFDCTLGVDCRLWLQGHDMAATNGLVVTGSARARSDRCVEFARPFGTR